MSYDNACKYLAEKYPQAFVRWLLGIDSPRLQILKTELIREPIHADSLLWLQVDGRILHLEFQSLPPSRPPLPLRMLDYSIYLKRQYQCPVEQVIIFLKETDSPLAFVEAYRDETTYHGYRVIRMWEQTPETFLNEPALLPLASLARSKKPEELLIEVARKVREIPEPDAQRQISGCTEILAGLRFTEPVIRSLFREEVMKESVIYQSIHSQGLQQGLQEEALRLVLRLLTLSLGEIPAYLKARIQTLSHEQLENLAESLLGFKNMGDVETWLQDI